MAENDIYNNKQKYDNFKSNLDLFLIEPAKRENTRHKGKYHYRNANNLAYFKKLFLKFESRDLSYVRRNMLIGSMRLICFASEKNLKDLERDDVDKSKLSRKPKRSMDSFEEEELNKLLEAISSTAKTNKEWFRDYVIIRLCAYLGLRISECLSIKEERIDFKKRILIIPAELTKTRTEQTVYLHDKAYYLLKDYIKKNKHRFRQGYLFYSTTQNSYHLKRQGFGRKVREIYLKLAGLDEVIDTDLGGNKRRRLRVHALRAYFCTKVFRENPDKRLNDIALVTRHKSLDTLNQHYIKINSIDQQKECMEKCFNNNSKPDNFDQTVELQKVIDKQNKEIDLLKQTIRKSMG